MATSYGTQKELLLAHGVGWASHVIPATVDVLAIMSNLAVACHEHGTTVSGFLP